MMKNRARDGKISLRPGEFAKEVTAIKGFSVCGKTVTRAAKDNDIEMLFNTPASNGAAPEDMSGLNEAVYQIERKLNAIMADLEINWEE
jgi:hypothetical protein